MEFPYEYFDDEIREGFYVSGLMKRMWAAQLEVYLDVVEVCRKYHLRWFADYGTLLGAVRHGGYIPWDDDFDICMLRDDYMKFIEVAEKELPSNYLIKNCHTTKDDFLTRIDNSRIPCFDDDFLKKYHECYLIAGIDIFPLDYMAPEGKEQEAHKFLLQAILSFRECLKDDRLDREQLDEMLLQLEQLSGMRFDRNADLVMQVYQASEAVCAVYGPEKATKVMLAPIWASSGNKTYPISCFRQSIQLPFEGLEIPVSAEYDTMLYIEYRNYMEIRKGGASHEYPCFREQEEFCIENIPDYKFLYKYDPEDLKEIKRLPSNKPGKRAVRFAELMGKAHQQIASTVLRGDFDKAFQLLETCQKGAINMGTMLEEGYGEGFISVGILEEYCEKLYQLSVRFNTCDDVHAAATTGCKELDSVIAAFEDSVRTNIHDKKEVVIIPYRASTWSTIEHVWETCKQDDACNVYVILPPYYERNGAGGFGAMHDESGELPDYVEVMPYDAYDFEERHPDIIYFQNPYDGCNYTTSVHPFFYSKNLKQYTEKLIYMPWFTMDEIDLQNGKVYQTMQYFCTVPGLFHADEVILSSEGTRRAYIERLTEFAGAATRALWEDKIKAGGISDEVLISGQVTQKRKIVFDKLPAAWKRILADERGGCKKLVVYNVTTQAFSQGGKNAIAKIEKTIQFFEKHRDRFVLMWRNNSAALDMLSKGDKRLSTAYTTILDSFKAAGWGIFDDILTYKEEAYLADAYYGDAGYEARFFETLGKPVMIQDIIPIKKPDMIEKVELRLDAKGNLPFHARACVCVDDALYVFPDEINILCKIGITDGRIEMLGSIPGENLNTVGLVSNIQFYDGQLILVPFNAGCPWSYDLDQKAWKKIAIEHESQQNKFLASILYHNKLYIFPFLYKYIICIDMESLEVRYLKSIYDEFRQMDIDEQCAFTASCACADNRVYLLNYHTNLILEFRLEDESYRFTFVGEKKQAYNSISWDGKAFYLIPRRGNAIVKWDGGEQITEYEVPTACQHVFDGLFSSNIIDGKLFVWGYRCDSLVVPLDRLDAIRRVQGRYYYQIKLTEDKYVQYKYRDSKLMLGPTGFTCETVFSVDELNQYMDGCFEKGSICLHGIIKEDDYVGLDYVVRGLQMGHTIGSSETAAQKDGSGNRKKIVFMPYSAAMWDSLESIWMAAKEDSRCETYVVPIPYYDKDAQGELTEYYYDGDNFPSYVPITDYRTFDMEQVDVIYIHNPYDDGNHVTSVAPEFYSERLKTRTKKLVYVPYFVTSGGMSEGQTLCRAYLNADYIIVQSERHKAFYDSMIPREKLVALGSPKLDRVIRLCQNPPAPPQEWAEKLSGKTVYFYNTSLHGMLDDTEAFMDKMEYVFHCFSGREAVCLLWRPHPLFETTIQAVRPEFKARYEALKEYFLSHELGIYDETPDIETTIALCDAYIGDTGTSVTALFGIAGKPLFILNNAIHRAPEEMDWLYENITPFLPGCQMEWKILQGNKLYYSENQDFTYRYYCDLSEYSLNGYYGFVYQMEEDIFAFPTHAQDILLLRDKKIIKRISLERTTERSCAFSSVKIIGNYAMLIPNSYRYIVRFDMRTYAVDYVDGCREFINVYDKNELRIGGSIIWNQYLLIASPVDNRVLALDCETLDIQVLCVEAKRYKGACALATDGEDVWLLPYIGTNVVRWNPITGMAREYNCRLDDFICNRRPQGSKCLQKAFGSIAVTEDKVVLAPFWGNQFVQIDKVTDEVKAFDVALHMDYHKDESYRPSGCQGYFLRKVGEEQVLFYHEMEHRLYELDLNTGAAKEIRINMDREELVRHASGFSICSEWFQYGCMENAFCTLEGFLNHELSGQKFDEELQRKVFGEIVANSDGRSGENIHQYVMAKLDS